MSGRIGLPGGCPPGTSLGGAAPTGLPLCESSIDFANDPPGQNVTTGAPAGTKGAETQLIASTAFDAFWLEVYAWDLGVSGVASDACLDLLIGGPPGSSFIDNMLCGYCPSNSAKVWRFNVFVPAGSRLAARAASLRQNATFKVAVSLWGGSAPHFPVGNSVTTYGITAVPDGTVVAVGTGVKGAWSEIVAATAADHIAFIPSFQFDDEVSARTQRTLVDLGSGAAGSEVVIGCGDYVFYGIANETQGGPDNGMPSFLQLPAGSRLAMRAGTQDVVADTSTGAIHAVSL